MAYDRREIDPGMIRWILNISIFGTRHQIEAFKEMKTFSGFPLGDLVKVTTVYDDMGRCDDFQWTTWTKILDERDAFLKAIPREHREKMAEILEANAAQLRAEIES